MQLLSPSGLQNDVQWDQKGEDRWLQGPILLGEDIIARQQADANCLSRGHSARHEDRRHGQALWDVVQSDGQRHQHTLRQGLTASASRRWLPMPLPPGQLKL
jgi:hypothetical protein